MRTKTIDVCDRLEEIETDEIPRVLEDQDDLVDLVNDNFEDYTAVPERIERKFDELEAERVELEGELNSLRAELVEWSSTYHLEELETDDGYRWDEVDWETVPSKFEIAKFNAATFASIEDEVVEQSFEMDVESENIRGTPKTGYGRILTCEKGIVAAPEGSPHKPSGEPQPGEYDNDTIQWLFDKINAYNTTGKTDLGNSSLRERMETEE